MSTARENRRELLLDFHFKMYAEYTDEYTPETLLFLFDVAGINSCKKKNRSRSYLGRALAHVSLPARLGRVIASDIIIGT